MGKNKNLRYCPCGRSPGFTKSKKGMKYICLNPKCNIPQPELRQTREEAEEAWNERCRKWDKH